MAREGFKSIFDLSGKINSISELLEGGNALSRLKDLIDNSHLPEIALSSVKLLNPIDN